MSEYSIVFLICHVLRTYTIIKFMRVFFEKAQINKKMEFAVYPLYYFAIIGVYFLFGNAIVNLLVNLVSFFLITFCYNTKFSKRIIAAVFVLSILTLLEFLVFAIFQIIPNARLGESIFADSISQVIVTIFSYLVTLILSNYAITKNDGDVSLARWLATISIPAMTILLTLLPVIESVQIDFVWLMILVSSMFFVNIIVFYLYDELSKAAQDKLEKEVILQQNTAFLNQLELIRQSNENISMFRHDMKNHFNALRQYIKADKNIALEYIDNAFNTIENKFEYSKSGNYVIDSILNFKTEQAMAQNIKVTLNMKIPTELDIEAFDLNVILGNLFDNAINGALLSEQKLIDIKMTYECDVLIIDFSNSYNGYVKIKDGSFATTKPSGEHGLGIPSTQRIIDKYNGEMLFDYGKEIFSIKVMIFKDSHINT